MSLFLAVDACSQASYSVLAEESQAFFKHSPHTNSIHKSAILRNNYISLLSRFYINRLLEGNNTLNNGVKARKLPSFSPVGERVLKLTLRDNYFIATVDILNAQAPWCLRFWDQCRAYYSLALQAWVDKRKITEAHGCNTVMKHPVTSPCKIITHA